MYNLDEIKKIPIINFVEGKRKQLNKYVLFEACSFCTHKWHFQINTEKNFYNSFNSCCKGGTIIDFIAERDKISVQDAIKYLAEKYDITATETISRKELKLIRQHEHFEEKRIIKIKNDFFRFLKRMQFDNTLHKCIKMDENRLVHYIYNLEGIGVYKI